MSGNQDRITTEKINRGRPKKLGGGRLDMIMGEYIATVRTECGLERRATLGDPEIAEAIEKKHGVKVSSDFIFRYRRKHGVASHYNSQGGPGRPPKFTDEDLSRMMAGYIFTEINSEKKITRQTDAKIAEELREKHGVEISEDTIRRYRMRHGITARHGEHGGRRPGSGRPKGDDMPPVKKSRNTHKLTISDYSLVRACPDAYDFKRGKWDERKGQYDRLPRYVPRFRQDGLKSYTPVIPFPDRYSKSQKYSALAGY